MQHSQMSASTSTPTSPTSKVNPSSQALGSVPSSGAGAAASSTSNNTTTIVKQLVSTFNDLNLKIDNNGEAADLTSEQFNVKQFASAMIKTNQLSEHLASLSQSLGTLDKEIREQVSTHYHDLLHQAINIETLDEMLDMIQTRIGSLKSSSERLRTKIGTPYNELNLRVLQLSRLQAACDTLRRIKGILFYASKLRGHMQAGVRDLVKSAQALNELDFLLKNFDDAAEIHVIEEDVHFAHKARREVEEQAQVILEKGMQHQDQTKIGTALQVFYSLGVLDKKLIECLRTSERTFQRTCQELLDTTNLTLQSTSSSLATPLHTSASAAFLGSSSSSSSGPSYPGRSTMPTAGSMGQLRAQLWTNVEKLMDAMYDSCAQVLQLQLILEKKKDLVSNLLYLDEIDFAAIFNHKMYLVNPMNSATAAGADTNSSDIAPSVLVYESICALLPTQDMMTKKTIEFLYDQWRTFSNVLSSSIVSSCSQSNYIKQTFQNEYPKLLKLANDLWLRLVQLSPMIDRYRYSSSSSTSTSSSNQSNKTTTGGGSSSTNFVSAYDLLRKGFQDLENTYLNQSLSHLFNPINLIFAQGIDKPLNKNDIESFIKGIQTLLQTLQYDIFNNSVTTNTILGNLKSTNPAIASILAGGTSSSATFSDKVVSSICKSIQMYSNKCEQLLNSLTTDLQQLLSNSSSAAAAGGSSSGGGSSLAASSGSLASSSSANLNSTSTGISSSNIFYYSSGQPYQIQMRTLDFVNQTHDLYEQLSRLFAGHENLNARQEERLRGALKSLVVFEENSLGLYVHAAADCILAIILTIHQEDFSNPNSNSLYMKELNEVMQRIVQNYLQQYACKSILSQFLNQLSTRCLDLFVRHAALLRPITDSHRLRLVNDANQLEQIVQTAMSTRLTDLGAHYKHLKALRALLKIAPADLLADTTSTDPSSLDKLFEDELLPHSLALHYLFAFGPSELKSPHQSLDWPVVKYSDWLDKHGNERERLMVIKTCLDTYVSVVRQKKEKKFAQVYPIMVRVLEKGLSLNSSITQTL